MGENGSGNCFCDNGLVVFPMGGIVIPLLLGKAMLRRGG
jgi:hypothetical protein